MALPRLETVQRRDRELRCPGEPFPGIERLAVVRHDRLGDLVLTLPALAALRATYPAAQLALAVQPPLAPLARMVECVDEVLAVEPDRLRESLADFAPQLVVCISRGAPAAWAAYRSGAAHRVGTGRRIFSWMFDRTVDESRRAGARHEVELSLSFAHRCGAPGAPARFPLCMPEAAEEEVSAWLHASGVEGAFVVLHPGSGGSCPSWPTDRFRALSRQLREQGSTVVFTAGPQDAPPDEPVVFSGGIEPLAALLRRAALVIASSTGPIHLASALGTKALALHAPWPSCGVPRWGPYGDGGYGLVVGEPDDPRSSAILERIEPGAVLERALQVLLGHG